MGKIQVLTIKIFLWFKWHFLTLPSLKASRKTDIYLAYVSSLAAEDKQGAYNQSKHEIELHYDYLIAVINPFCDHYPKWISTYSVERFRSKLMFTGVEVCQERR